METIAAYSAVESVVNKDRARPYYAQIIPDPVQNQLLYLRDRLTESYFVIGDITNALIAGHREGGASFTARDIYLAVGKFVGKSGRTVRYYAETAAFFSEAERQAFIELPFSHFVFARSFDEREKAVEVLEYSRSLPFLSLEALKLTFGECDFLGERINVSEVERVREVVLQPVQVDVVSDLAQIAANLERMLTRTDFSEEIRIALEGVCQVLTGFVLNRLSPGSIDKTGQSLLQ